MRGLVEFLDKDLNVAQTIEDCVIVNAEASHIVLTWEDQTLNILNPKIILGEEDMFIWGAGDKGEDKYYLRVKLQIG